MQRVQCNQLSSKWLVGILKRWWYFGGSTLASASGRLDIWQQEARSDLLRGKKYIWVHAYLSSQPHDYSVHEPIIPALGASVTRDDRHQLPQSFCLLICLVLLSMGALLWAWTWDTNTFRLCARLQSSVYRPLIQISFSPVFQYFSFQAPKQNTKSFICLWYSIYSYLEPIFFHTE